MISSIIIAFLLIFFVIIPGIFLTLAFLGHVFTSGRRQRRAAESYRRYRQEYAELWNKHNRRPQ